MKEEGLGHGSGSFRLQGTRTAVFPKDMLVQRCISGSWPKEGASLKLHSFLGIVHPMSGQYMAKTLVKTSLSTLRTT